MDHATATIFLYNFGALCNNKSALCDIRCALRDIRSVVCNIYKGALYECTIIVSLCNMGALL